MRVRSGRAFETKHGAFSLIEALVVIAIVGALGAASVTGYLNYRARARNTAAAADADRLQTVAMRMWTMDRSYQKLDVTAGNTAAETLEFEYNYTSTRAMGKWISFDLAWDAAFTKFTAKFYHPYGDSTFVSVFDNNQIKADAIDGAGTNLKHIHPTDPSNGACYVVGQKSSACYHNSAY